MKIDIDKMISLVWDEWEADREYRMCKPEEKDRKYLYYHSSEECLYALKLVFKMNESQIDRMYTAARAFRKWSEKHEWQISMKPEMARQIGEWIFGEKILKPIWYWKDESLVTVKFETWYQ